MKTIGNSGQTLTMVIELFTWTPEAQSLFVQIKLQYKNGMANLSVQSMKLHRDYLVIREYPIQPTEWTHFYYSVRL